jgi:hypothetical protein
MDGVDADQIVTAYPEIESKAFIMPSNTQLARKRRPPAI